MIATEPEMKRYASVAASHGDLSFVTELSTGKTWCTCPGKDHAEKAAITVAAMNLWQRTQGDVSGAVLVEAIVDPPIVLAMKPGKTAGRLGGTEN